MIDNFSVILPLQSFVKIVIAYQVVYDVFKNYVGEYIRVLVGG